ncbi:arginine deiminase-related protein [Glaciimonas sp. CA11.2]|uniref:dimethylarginine dimethylaminohydrolase family protein n=1 Tax=Glaciimonas sp. CA11.2 TaxID=3048601 RepID=UPI002AB47CEE|nr:arginine deiminase-related protein [Glaciimonas sp. CA11.2]MDY7546255.1 arginine deiminase-related protein [Glaciimonas sp. CA11.2]MEB0162143.1 arginine deiminase-related protein [Glaciimonas sp. CA11.2]
MTYAGYDTAQAGIEKSELVEANVASTLSATKSTYLMCAPDYFEVAYVINPWMAGNIAHADHDVASLQWEQLVSEIASVAIVQQIPAKAGVPDLVFTANGGVVRGNKVVLSRFRHVERQAEESHFEHWFAAHGFEVLKLASHLPFEGAGDALLDRHDDLLWFGHGHRSDVACAEPLSQLLDVEVQPLRLVDARYYHLDTCFCPLEGGEVMYFPDAFDAASQIAIAARVPPHRRLIVSADDALHFACNSVNCGQHIFLNCASVALVNVLTEHGYIVHQTPLTEFLKAGGAAKCLTLKLNEPVPCQQTIPSVIRLVDAVDCQE